MVVVGGLILWASDTSNGFPWDRYVGWLLTIGVLGFLSLDGGSALTHKRRVQQMAA